MFIITLLVLLYHKGTYDCDVYFPTKCTAGCGIQYCISTNSTTPDSVVKNIVGAYTIVLVNKKT